MSVFSVSIGGPLTQKISYYDRSAHEPNVNIKGEGFYSQENRGLNQQS
jgi:hypothetical protein